MVKFIAAKSQLGLVYLRGTLIILRMPITYSQTLPSSDIHQSVVKFSQNGQERLFITFIVGVSPPQIAVSVPPKSVPGQWALHLCKSWKVCNLCNVHAQYTVIAQHAIIIIIIIIKLFIRDGGQTAATYNSK